MEIQTIEHKGSSLVWPQCFRFGSLSSKNRCLSTSNDTPAHHKILSSVTWKKKSFFARGEEDEDFIWQVFSLTQLYSEAHTDRHTHTDQTLFRGQKKTNIRCLHMAQTAYSCGLDKEPSWFHFAGSLRALIAPTVTSSLGVIPTEDTEKQTYIQKWTVVTPTNGIFSVTTFYYVLFHTAVSLSINGPN